MSRDWKKWAADKGLHKWFQRDNFIILVLAGILLVIIALPTKEDTGQKGDKTITGNDSQFLSSLGHTDQQGTSAQEPGEDKGYADALEERLTETLSHIAGVGKVRVMITLKSSSELIVEKEQPVNRSSVNETDSQGGSRISSEVASEENTVYRTDGNVSEPYVVKTLPPQVEGVLVVAEGAGSGTINRTIVDIIQALFGVEAHKVQVVKME